MKSFFFRLLTAFALTTGASFAIAQDHTSADELIQAGLSSLRQIDEDRSGELWDTASAFVKAKFTKAEFVGNVRRSRQTVGTVVRRDWAGVIRIRYLDDSAGVPAGQYANVDYATHLSNNQTAFEKVSFRLEPDGWHLTGYIPRDKQ
jgi:hypothetical protein